MRKEVIGNATLYLGDCLSVLSDFRTQEVDAIITDPPYGIGESLGRNKSRGNLAVAKDYGNMDWDKSPPHPRVITQMRRVANKLGVFGGNHIGGWAGSTCWLVWDKVNGDNHFADCELVYTNLDKAVRKIRYAWNGMIQENMKEKEVRVHPTQKPIKVMQWVIDQFSLQPGSLIVDPFMGSGTTGVAAHISGHRFMGVEQEKKYFDIACKRIEQAQRQKQLF